MEVMRKYECRVRMIQDRHIVVYAKNKDKAKEEACRLCTNGWGIPITSRKEVISIEHISK